MQKALAERSYFFVDEAGDSTFYNAQGEYIVGQEGCSKVLLLGFVRTENPHALRVAINALHNEIQSDAYLSAIPSIVKTNIAFHAKNDCPEVRERVFKLLSTLDFTAEFIVARKIESIFRNKHKGKGSIFYNDLIIKLFENKLHLARNNHLYFAVRGNKTRQRPLEEAIQTAINSFESKWDHKMESQTQVLAQTPSDEPCIQIADYMNWTVQRAFQRGEERYYKFIESKVAFLCDTYDTKKYPKIYYSKKNPFSINKISPL